MIVLVVLNTEKVKRTTRNTRSIKMLLNKEITGNVYKKDVVVKKKTTSAQQASCKTLIINALA